MKNDETCSLQGSSKASAVLTTFSKLRLKVRSRDLFEICSPSPNPPVGGFGHRFLPIRRFRKHLKWTRKKGHSLRETDFQHEKQQQLDQIHSNVHLMRKERESGWRSLRNSHVLSPPIFSYLARKFLALIFYLYFSTPWFSSLDNQASISSDEFPARTTPTRF